MTLYLRKYAGALGLACAVLTSPYPAAAADAVVYLSLSVDVAAPGTAIDAEVIVETDRPLGAYGFTLNCDEAALEILPPVRGGDTDEFASRPFQNPTGPCTVVVSNFQAVSLQSPSGTVSVAHVDLRVRDDAPLGTEQLLDLTIFELSDADGAPLVNTAEDATVSIPGGNPTLCGDVNGDGQLTASDALATLRSAVNIQACDFSTCDVDASGSVTASDALRILKAAVGLSVELVCP